MTGRFEEAETVLEEAIARSAVAPTAAARARLVRLLVRLRTGAAEGWQRGRRRREIAATIEVFEAAGDEAGLAMAWRLARLGGGHRMPLRRRRRGRRLRAIEHAQRAGDVRQERRAATAYAGAAPLGPTLVDEAIARCEAAIEQTAGDRQSEGKILAVLATLYAMQGAFDHARTLVARARALFEELGLDSRRGPRSASRRGGSRCWRATSTDGRACKLRRAYDALDARRREVPPLDGCRAARADAARAAGRSTRPRRSASRAASSRPRPTSPRRRSGGVSAARLLARHGALAEAEAIVREALELLEPTDATVLQHRGAARARGGARGVGATGRVRARRLRGRARAWRRRRAAS